MKYPAPLTGTNKTGTLLAHASCLINSSFFYASFAFCPGDFEPVCWPWQKLEVSETSSVLPIFSSIHVWSLEREKRRQNRGDTATAHNPTVPTQSSGLGVFSVQTTWAKWKNTQAKHWPKNCIQCGVICLFGMQFGSRIMNRSRNHHDYMLH